MPNSQIKFFKKITLSLSIVVCLCVASTNVIANQTEDIQKITSKKELVVAVHKEDSPLFHMKLSTGDMVGFEADIAKAIAEALSVKVRFDRTATSYDGVVDLVANGRADMAISTLSFTPERALKVLYPENPYIILKSAAIVNRIQLAKAGKVSLEQLLTNKTNKNKNNYTASTVEEEAKIGVLKGGAYYEKFAKSKFPTAKLVYFNGWEDLVAAVEKGEVTAGFSDINRIKNTLSSKENLILNVLPLQFPDNDNLYFVCSPNLPNLTTWISNLIKNNPNLNISYKEIERKYSKKKLLEP